MTRDTKLIVFIASVIVAVALGLMAYNLFNENTDNVENFVEVNNIEDAPGTISAGNEGNTAGANVQDTTPDCWIKESDVVNIPEGWRPVIFSSPCIGLALPETDGMNSVVTVSTSEEPEIILSNSFDVREVTRMLYVIVSDTKAYLEIPERCTSYVMDGFSFCYERIVTRWEGKKFGEHTLYLPTGTDLPRVGFSRAVIVTEDGNKFVAFEYVNKTNDDGQALLNEMLKTVIVGN